MRSTHLIACAAMLVLVCAGCSETGPRVASVDKTLLFRATGEAFLERVEHDIGAPSQNWDTLLEETGHGLPAANASTENQKELTALESARLGAMAKLTERIKGIHVARDSQVRNMQFAGEQISANLEGDLTGIKVVAEHYDAEQEIAQVTVRVGLDSEGKIVPDRLLPITPLSVAARQARAAMAARVDAWSKLREQIGEVYVTQEVRVKNLMLSHQRARLLVEGILEGAKFSEPKWPKHDHCLVDATLKVTPADLERLRGLVQPVR